MNAVKKTLATLALLLLGFVSVPAASAHTEIDHTSPAAGSSVEAGTQTVSVGFTDKILDLANSSEIVITDPDGNEVPTSCLEVQNTALNEEAFFGTAGDYKAVWRTVAEDGHAISGDFTFTVTGTADNTDFVSCKDAASQTTVIATPKAYSTTHTEVVVSSQEARIARLYWIGGIALVLVAGVMFFVIRRKRSKA
jgi:methionine-rich copper-binding protein CopC